MPLNVANVHAYGDITNTIRTSVIGTAFPATPTAAYTTGWYDLGWIDDGGVTETIAYQETKKFGWQGASLLRVLRSQAEHNFKFNCLEESAVTLGLIRPNTTQVTAGATAEVQTITITGTPAGGTFGLTNIGYGAAALPLQAFNIPTATLKANLDALGLGTFTVTGTAGTSYVVTFPQSLGNVPTMGTTNQFTGGSSPALSVAVTTPGVSGTTSWAVAPFVGRNLRQFCIDLIDTPVHRRFQVASGEITSQGDIVFKADDLTVYQFQLACYPDGAGNFFTELSDNPSVGSGLYA